MNLVKTILYWLLPLKKIFSNSRKTVIIPLNNLCHTIINCSENSFWLFLCFFFIYHTFLKLSDFKHKQKSSLKIIVYKVFYFFEHFIPLTQFCEQTLSDNFWATGYVFHQARLFSNCDFWEILTIHSKKHLKINFGS